MSSAFEGLPKTPNLKLNKPGYDNVADIEALNENADILDAEIQGIKNTFVKSVNGINAGDGGNVDLGIIPISQGGTGATTASQACANLSALPTTGGTMTGDIKFAGSTEQMIGVTELNDFILGSDTASLLRLRGLTSDGNQGGFQIRAKNSTESAYLIGYPNGDLTWNGKEVLRCEELVKNASTLGNNSITLSNGLIMQFFYVQLSSGAAFVNYPKAFPNTCCEVFCQHLNLGREQSPTAIEITYVSNTNFYVKCYYSNTGSQYQVRIDLMVLAIGY